MSHWNCPVRIVTLELSHWDFTIEISPLEFSHRDLPIGIILLEFSHVELSHLEQSHWEFPIGNVLLGLAHWNHPIRIFPLELSHWDHRIGIFPLELIWGSQKDFRITGWEIYGIKGWGFWDPRMGILAFSPRDSRFSPFSQEHPDLRRSSIILFGNLSRFSRSDSEVFSEQILNGLVTLLLHLQDPEPGVVKACKFALRMCGPSLGCEELREMFGNHLREERGIHYGEFINDVCKGENNSTFCRI
uniref:Maestro/Maestro-like HEAT-repeats domain-containing protein n=1 Tax=Zosterops lateralis melanops TaxID=1220523 RepID=A0A8D2QQQ9_ZOSLA